MQQPTRQFRYVLDPLCLTAAVVYLAHRWWLAPAGWSNEWARAYLNDVLCLPLFLPVILLLLRWTRVRKHDGPPTLWEVLHHWLIFAVVYELVLPRFPSVWHTNADAWDVVAYLAGGLLAWTWWQCGWRARWRRHTISTVAASEPSAFRSV